MSDIDYDDDYGPGPTTGTAECERCGAEFTTTGTETGKSGSSDPGDDVYFEPDEAVCEDCLAQEEEE